MPRDESPQAFVPTLPDKPELEALLLTTAERLLPQLTDAEWNALASRLKDLRLRLREFQFDQTNGYFY